MNCIYCSNPERRVLVMPADDLDVLPESVGKPVCFNCAPKAYDPRFVEIGQARVRRRARSAQRSLREHKRKHSRSAHNLACLPIDERYGEAVRKAVIPNIPAAHVEVAWCRRVDLMTLALDGPLTAERVANIVPDGTRKLRTLERAGLLKAQSRRRYVLSEKGRELITAILTVDEERAA